jgi:hypothetical protein
MIPNRMAEIQIVGANTCKLEKLLNAPENLVMILNRMNVVSPSVGGWISSREREKVSDYKTLVCKAYVLQCSECSRDLTESLG